jgi:dTDP-glucose pyrophosphorylase
MKAVILARGLGTRMRELDATSHTSLDAAQAAAAGAGSKAMMPVGTTADGQPGRPFLDYVLGAVIEAGGTELAVVIGPEHGSIRQRYSQDVPVTRARLAFIEQPAPLGTANAVLACEAWAGDDPFLVMNADNLYPVDAVRRLAQLDGPGLPVFERHALVGSSNIPAERVAAFALVETDARGDLVRIEEKPSTERMQAAGPRALVSMNCWRFDERIFDACRDVPRSTRGEFELPHAVGLAVERGVRFQTVAAIGPVLDLSRRSDVADVSRRLAGMEPAL